MSELLRLSTVIVIFASSFFDVRVRTTAASAAQGSDQFHRVGLSAGLTATGRGHAAGKGFPDDARDLFRLQILDGQDMRLPGRLDIGDAPLAINHFEELFDEFHIDRQGLHHQAIESRVGHNRDGPRGLDGGDRTPVAATAATQQGPENPSAATHQVRGHIADQRSAAGPPSLSCRPEYPKSTAGRLRLCSV